MAKQLNGQAEDRDNDEGMNFEEFIKSMDSMEPEEVRAAFNDLIETLEAEGEPVPFSLRMLASEVLFGLTETPFGLVYAIGGLGQLMLTGFISQEDITEVGSADLVLEEIMDDFSENFTMVQLVRDDAAIDALLKNVLEGNYAVDEGVFEAMDATQLQLMVWKELTKIPYGQTISYEQLAERVGKPKAVRAVASAVGNNPLSIVIPCHRVILKNGETGEYHWGQVIKEKLLAYEKTNS